MKVELVFDPFELTEIEVRASGRTAGKGGSAPGGPSHAPKGESGDADAVGTVEGFVTFDQYIAEFVDKAKAEHSQAG